MLKVQLYSLESINNIILAGIIVIFILLMILFRRNIQVLKYRLHVIDLISQKNIEEVKSGISYTGSRYRMFDQVPSYDKMVLKFWKPLDTFFNLNDLLK